MHSHFGIGTRSLYGIEREQIFREKEVEIILIKTIEVKGLITPNPRKHPYDCQNMRNGEAGGQRANMNSELRDENNDKTMIQFTVIICGFILSLVPSQEKGWLLCIPLPIFILFLHKRVELSS
jgi:hypothetical protein